MFGRLPGGGFIGRRDRYLRLPLVVKVGYFESRAGFRCLMKIRQQKFAVTLMRFGISKPGQLALEVCDQPALLLQPRCQLGIEFLFEREKSSPLIEKGEILIGERVWSPILGRNVQTERVPT